MSPAKVHTLPALSKIDAIELEVRSIDRKVMRSLNIPSGINPIYSALSGFIQRMTTRIAVGNLDISEDVRAFRMAVNSLYLRNEDRELIEKKVAALEKLVEAQK